MDLHDGARVRETAGMSLRSLMLRRTGERREVTDDVLGRLARGAADRPTAAAAASAGESGAAAEAYRGLLRRDVGHELDGMT